VGPKAIDAIANGEQEQLSCGYRYVADMSPGTTPDGEKYDGVMRGLKCNHVALVEVGRAGPDVLVSDELPQDFTHMKISALVKALGPVLATDAKPADVSALISTVIAQDKKAKDDAVETTGGVKLEKGDKPEGKDAAVSVSPTDPEGTNDEDPDAEVDADDEFPEKPEGGAEKPDGKPSAKDKKGKDKAMDKKAMDAAIAAGVNAGLAADRALQTARREVEAIVGVTAFDSAGATYGAALKKLGIATDGVPSEAFGAMLRVALNAGKQAAPALATDSAGAKSLREAFPNYNRLSR